MDGGVATDMMELVFGDGRGIYAEEDVVADGS